MGQFPICKLKLDLLRTSVTACTIDKNTFSAPIWNLLCQNGNLNRIFSKKVLYNTINGVLLIFKLPFPNGSYHNGVCRALWALLPLEHFCPSKGSNGVMSSIMILFDFFVVIGGITNDRTPIFLTNFVLICT